MLRSSRIYSNHIKNKTGSKTLNGSKLHNQKSKRQIGTEPRVNKAGEIIHQKIRRFVPKAAVYINRSNTDRTIRENELYDVNSVVYGRLGEMIMNRQHKYNIFTQSYLKQLDRTLNGFELYGEDLRLLRFHAKDRETFSRGTDIKTLLHHSENKDMDPIVEYLNLLYNFQTAFARNNLPTISTITGKLENSANCLVGSAGLSTIEREAELVFNETHPRNRIIPHAGASFYLTRMPGELGTFLALTGTPFTGSEAKEILGLADEIMYWNKDLEQSVIYHLRYIDKTNVAANLHVTDGIREKVDIYKHENRMRNHFDDLYHADKFDGPHSQLGFKRSTYDAAQKHRAEESIDRQYEKLLRKDLEHKALHDATKLGSGTTGHYLNHYAHIMDYIKPKLPFEGGDLTDSILRRYENDINRCFYPDSIEEIIENLKKENTNFSKYCLQKLQENDRTALNVTLALLRKAIKGSYSDCCHLEYKALLNVLKNEHKVDAKTPFTKELIEEYFKTPEEYKHVKLEVKDQAPLPTRKYYQKYADHMRLLMNEHNSFNAGIREGYDREVQSELREVGIDIRDSGLTAQTIRTSLWNKEQVQRSHQYTQQLESYFVNDDKFTERYYADVAKLIENLSEGKEAWRETHKDYYELVNDLVYKCFVDALMKNIELMLEKNRDLHKIKKKRFFLKLKKFFFEKRLIDSEKRRDLIENLRLGSLPKVLTTFSDDINDNIYESYEKNRFDTIEDFEKLLIVRDSFYSAEVKAVERRRHERRLTRLNGYDPLTESKYWEEYVKYRDINMQQKEIMDQRLKRRLAFREEVKLSEEEIKKIIEDNKTKLLNNVVDSVITGEVQANTIEDKSLNELIDKCVKQNPEFDFLQEGVSIWDTPDPKCVQKFREQFRTLLTKYVQIGVLNSTADDLSKGALKFFKLEQTPSMDALDTMLSQKVNNNVIKKLIENVSPALNVSFKRTIEGEAKKILFSLNHQDNLTAVLLHLLYLQENPEVINQKLHLEAMLEELKDDPDISRMVKNRPTNEFMTRGASSPDLKKKVEEKIRSYAYEDPIETLNAFWEAIGLTGFDISHGDANKKAHIEAELRRNLGQLENPIEDAMKYSLTLLMAYNCLTNSSQLTANESLEGCLKLLGSTKDAGFEVNELIRTIQDQKFLTTLQKENGSKALSEHLETKCDVESLIKLNRELKGSPSYSSIKPILGYIDSTLSHTANIRRKNMSIGEFLSKDSNIDMSLLSKTADTILREKTTEVAKRLVHFSESDIVIQASEVLSPDIKEQLVDALAKEKERVIDLHSLQPFTRDKDPELVLNHKIREAVTKTIKMSDDLEFTRTRIENEILRAFTRGQKDDNEKVQQLINRWVDIRVIDLKSKPTFNQLYNSEFKYELVNNFKENIAQELGLTNLSKTVMSFEEFEPYDPTQKGFNNDIANSVMRQEKDYLMHDIGLKTDTTDQHMIIQNSIGYDNLIERLQAPEKSYDLAHKNLAEKLLAEYYIDKRKDYRASKEMLEALDKEFHASKYIDQTKRIGEDLRGVKLSMPTSHDQGLSAWDALNNSTREDVILRGEDQMTLIKLGNATHLAIHGPTHGVAESLAKYTTEEIKWPERLPKFDVRRKPKEWIEEKLSSVLNSLFSARESIERNMPLNDSFYGNSTSTRSDR